jgi:hypothetical protein
LNLTNDMWQGIFVKEFQDAREISIDAQIVGQGDLKGPVPINPGRRRRPAIALDHRRSSIA